MSRKKEFSIVFSIGAIGYSLLEVLWRGYTHWSMTITGGLCLSLLYIYRKKHVRQPLLLQCFAGSAIITSIEFSVGCIVNLLLHLNVWDYSSLRFQILGQVSLLFSALWFLLCVPVLLLCSWMDKKFQKIRKRLSEKRSMAI